MASKSTANDIFTKLRRMSGEAEDSLTRFYLRLLIEKSWSYNLRKEKILLKNKSQEAYRKALNKFVKDGFLVKHKQYYMDGKPRIPFEANPETVYNIIERYCFMPMEHKAAIATFERLRKNPEWVKCLNEKLKSGSRLKFLNTLFPLVFMGPEISKFFFKLLFVTVIGASTHFKDDEEQEKVYGVLVNILENVEMSFEHEGIDYIGKRFFLDIYVKEAMDLMYAVGAMEKHHETMRVAILEDITIPILTPLKHANVSEDEFDEFCGLSMGERVDRIFEYVNSVKDHFIKDYYGENWETELSCFIAYAIIETLEEPNDDVVALLKHLQTRYGVTREGVDMVSKELKDKFRVT